jgi:short-subunit dehydrogenase
MRFIEGDICKVDETLLEKLSGNYDIVICNAGISLSGNFTSHSSAENGRLMNINTL